MKQYLCIITLLLITTLSLISLELFASRDCKIIGKQQSRKYQKSWYKPIKPFKQGKIKTIYLTNSVCNCTEYNHKH